MGLYIRIFCIVELAKAIDCQLLYLVYDLTATVIAFAGITFCVFIGAD